MGFLWFWKLSAIISLCSISLLVSEVEMHIDLLAVWSELLNIIFSKDGGTFDDGQCWPKYVKQDLHNSILNWSHLM
jgi:hypothetical protein